MPGANRWIAPILVVTVFGLLALGLTMIFSVGAASPAAKGDAFKFVRDQSMAVSLGLVAMVVLACWPYQTFRRFWWVILLATIGLLWLCFRFDAINGSQRWIRFGGQNFQPSEMAKLALVIALAWWYARYPDRAKTFLYGILIPVLLVVTPLALVIKQPDVGTTILMVVVTGAVIFIAGANLIYLGLTGLVAVTAVSVVIQNSPQRLSRVMAIFDLEAHKDGVGYQQYQGIIAIGSGGIGGLGLGKSRQKMLYVPEAHNDFIFTVLGEELGLSFSLGVIFAFCLIAYAGLGIGLRAKDRFGMILAFGLTLNLVLQAALNFGVTLAVLPNTGITLPFVSYGGSSVLASLVSIGILLNIHKQGRAAQDRSPRVVLQARVPSSRAREGRFLRR